MKLLNYRQFTRLEGHKASIYTLSKGVMNFDFISGGGDGFLVGWNLDGENDGELIANIPEQILSTFNPIDTNAIWVGSMEGNIHIFDLRKKERVRTIQSECGYIFRICEFQDKMLALTKSGNLLEISKNGDSILRKIKISREALRSYEIIDNQLIIGASDGNIYILNEQLEILSHFEAHDPSVFCLQYDSKNKILYSGGRDAHISAWNPQKKYELCSRIPAHNLTVNELEFISEPDVIVSVSRDNSVKFWDMESQTLLKVLNATRDLGHRHSVNTVLYLKERNLLITAGDDKRIICWNI